LTYCDQKIVDDQVQEWLKEGNIQPSTSEFTSPVMLVDRKNVKKRLCCDYRKLNEKMDCVIIKRVLEVSQGNGLPINISKCQVLKRKLNFFGCVVENGTMVTIPRDMKGV